MLIVKPNMIGIRSLGLRGPGVHALVETITNETADKAAAKAGWNVIVGGPTPDAGGWMRVEFDPTPNRARGAILAQHPRAAQRESGKDILQRSI